MPDRAGQSLGQAVSSDQRALFRDKEAALDEVMVRGRWVVANMRKLRRERWRAHTGGNKRLCKRWRWTEWCVVSGESEGAVLLFTAAE